MPVQANEGDELDSQCGRCHDATRHKVLTLDEKGRAKRCVCLVCDGKHLWRKPKGPEPRTGKTKAEKAAEAEAKRLAEAAMEFEAAWAAAAESQQVSYSIRGSFEQGQRLLHKKFGEGVVITVTGPGTLQVRFREGVRALVMNK